MANTKWTTPLAILAAIFGAATLYSGGKALFGGADMGNTVPFVLWFNFAMGFAYLTGAALIYLGHPASLPIAWSIGIATSLVFAAFVITALMGTAFEMRTVGSMILRAGFWLATALLLQRKG